MNTDWPTIAFEHAPIEIIDGDRGKNYPKKTDFLSSGYCLFLDAGNVTAKGFDFAKCSFITRERDQLLRKGRLKRDDLVLTTRGTVGNVAWFSPSVPYEIIRINSGMVIFRPDPAKILPRFLYIFLRSHLFEKQVAIFTTGSAQPQLPIKDIRRIEMSIPPIWEQVAISEVLGALDDKIELNREMNRTLEAIAKAIFKPWFVNFDPVKARADGRQPFGMDAETAALFPERFIDSELGPIPEGWEVGSIGDIGENLQDGIRPNEIDPATPYIGLEHMPRRSIALDKWECAGKVTSNKSEFKAGDILFGKLRPYFHKVGVAVVDGICSTDALVIRPKDSIWLGILLCHLSSKDFIDYTDAGSTGTKMPRTSWKYMTQYAIALPPSLLVQKFAEYSRSILEKIQANIMESHTLTALRDTLLPKLLSAEIRVGQAEEAAEEVI